ncbi:unnamed protein product [Laminaria digitata]
MSRNRDRKTYTFKRHRDALYAILEAVVTEGAAEEDDDVDVDSSSGGGPSTFSRTRQPANLESNDGGHETGGETSKTYPSDVLWYEEMTPADIDAYHAAHRDTPGGSSGGAPTADPFLDHRGTPPTPPTAAPSSRRDHRHGGHGCSESSDGYGSVAAGGGDDEVVVAKESQAPPPPPPPRSVRSTSRLLFALPTTPPPVPARVKRRTPSFRLSYLSFHHRRWSRPL